MPNNPYLRIFETLFIRLSLFHFSAALFPLILSGGSSEGDGVDINSLDLSLIAKINVLIYVIAFALVFLRWKKALSAASQAIFFWPFIILAAFSNFWSSIPESTSKGVVYALGATILGIYFATRYTIKEQLDHLAWTLGFIIVLSILFVVAIPQYGIMGGVHEGAIRGIFIHKNVFAPVIVLAVVVFFLEAIDAKKNQWLLWGFLIISIALGVLSRSSSALGLMVVMLFLCLCYRIFRWRYEALVSAILLILVLGVAGILWFVEFGGAELLFNAIGKDATLSSRTEIWSYVWDSIKLKPWLGYGLEGYWNGLNGPSAYIERSMRVPVHYAHNGFLDICLSFGFIGFFLFVGNFLLVVSKSLALLRKSNTVAGFWPLILLTYIFLSNLTEGSLASLNTMTWVLYTTVVFSFVTTRSDKMFL